MKRLVVLALALAACGPKPTPAVVPVLPGDGDAHVAKPSVTTKPTAADPWAGRTDLITAPAPKPPAPVELPQIESYKLANGLQVFVIKSDRLPVASLQLAIKAGRMHEPRARLGVSEFTSDMLVKGTRRRDAVALAKAIDFVGGTIAADSTFEATLMSCSVLARSLGTCLELVPEMLTQPSFPESELAKVRDQMLGRVRQRLDDAGGLASAHVQNLLWGNEHVRGWISNEQSVAAIRRDDLVAWHKTWFVPGNAMLVVAGDVDAKKLKGDLERSFGVWKKGPVPPTPSYKEPGLSGSRIRLVDKPGQTQTHIRIAQFGIKHDDARFFDSLVWNYALGGGGFSSRMMRVVRVEGGKSYGASSSFDRNVDKGSFVAQSFTRNAEAVTTTKLLLAEIAKMAKDGPTQDEVSSAIANIAGGYGLRFQAAADVGAALIGAELHGFGREYLTNYPVAVGKVDVESAKRAASEILDPKAYVIVMVGDAKDLEPLLKKEGWRYQKVAFTETITAPVAVPDAPIDPKVAAAAKQLLAEAIAAKGGHAKLSGLKGFKMIATGSTTISGQTVPVEIERVYVLPDKMRIDALLAGRVKVIVAVDGKAGWQLAPDPSGAKIQLTEISASDLASIEFEQWREPELILLRAQEPGARLSLGPDEVIDGRPHAVLKLDPQRHVDVTLYIDKKTKLVTRMSYSETAGAETDQFSDYKDVGGLKIAHKRHSKGSGRETKLELKAVELDPKLDPKLFEKPTVPAATPAPKPAPTTPK
ncbi:MAG: insulinase family protein [Deltaproteobacteria bacterium]|nr:insulinase family protein [Deltaproteobacteria bacterium]MDQ3300650.1 insulinase family protein [Myxococcota bacterium]